MSRRIVQLAAVPASFGNGLDDSQTGRLYALDQNGIAWVMFDPSRQAVWHRLPELPSALNKSSPSATPEQLAQEDGE